MSTARYWVNGRAGQIEAPYNCVCPALVADCAADLYAKCGREVDWPVEIAVLLYGTEVVCEKVEIWKVGMVPSFSAKLIQTAP